jgi:hypothetical protein
VEGSEGGTEVDLHGSSLINPKYMPTETPFTTQQIAAVIRHAKKLTRITGDRT